MLDWLHTTERLLTTRSLGRGLEGFLEIDSTNARALTRAAEGAPSGAVVVAEFQSAGRGRLGRRWDGGRGESLLFSVIWRPDADAGHFGLTPLATGLALRDAVQGYTGDKAVDLKWPNDLLVGGRKCAGVLVESVIMSGRERWAVIGVGLNVNQTEFPSELEAGATSLRLAGGREVARPVLLAELLGALEERIEQMESFPDQLVSQYGRALRGTGESVTVAQADGRLVRGTLMGIDSSGALRVASPDGDRLFTAGEVTLSKAVPT